MQSTIKWKIAQKLEMLWWRKYLLPKQPDAYLAWKKDYWQRFVMQSGFKDSLIGNQNILDAGCGPAGIFCWLNNTNQVVAMDPLLDKYREGFPLLFANYGNHLRFTNKAIEQLAESNTYDHIFCLNAINHVSDLKAAMANLFRAQKPGGLCWLSIDAHRFGFLKQLFRLVPGDALHPHQLDLQEYESIFKEVGYHLQKTIKVKSGGIFDYYLLIGKK